MHQTHTSRYFDLRASLGYEGLKADVSRFMESGDSKLTALVPPLQGIDPDDAFSSVRVEAHLFLFIQFSLVRSLSLMLRSVLPRPLNRTHHVQVPYERGMNLLFHLQGLIGKANMHKFFRTYVETHAATTVLRTCYTSMCSLRLLRGPR